MDPQLQKGGKNPYYISLVRIRLGKELIFYHSLGLTLVKDLLCSFEFDVYGTSMYITLVVGCFNKIKKDWLL